ncbi:MAG: ribbon-helix-helix domain-containing protein [Thermoleophilia bacterium]
MKLSLTLPHTDVAFLDDYASRHGIGSRSEAIRYAVGVLRATELGPAYVDAWASWDAVEGRDWDVTSQSVREP